jgi:hypothetical protein
LDFGWTPPEVNLVGDHPKNIFWSSFEVRMKTNQYWDENGSVTHLKSFTEKKILFKTNYISDKISGKIVHRFLDYIYTDT